MNRSDLMRGTLATLLILSFEFALAALFNWKIPKENEQLLTYMLGQLSGMVTMALGFWFTTSQSSHRKDQIIANMAETPKAVKIEQSPDNPVPVDVAPQGSGDL